MTRRKGQRADRSGDDPRGSGDGGAAAKGAGEGQGRMADGKKRRAGDGLPFQWMRNLSRREHELLDNNPLYLELSRQQIRLRDNGYELPWCGAQAAVDTLRDLQHGSSADFAVLVALVKPRRATVAPVAVTPKVLASLVERRPDLLNDDGSVQEHVARVLDASYTLTEKGEVVLRDPVDYPSREWVEKYAAVERKVRSERERIDRLAAEEAAEERRRRGGGPSL